LGGESVNARTYDPGVAAAPEIHRWSPEDYHRLVETGALEDLRVELIDGFIVDMRPRSPSHDYAMWWLDDRLRDLVDRSRHWVRVGMALSLGDSEPEPDIAVVAATRDHAWHPPTAALAIEVSHSSLRRDLQVKPRIYANAGIPLYWVVDLDGRRAVVHSEPRQDGYARVETTASDATLSAPELGVSISLAELLEFAIR
jgi:Uma2 family endonuclease